MLQRANRSVPAYPVFLILGDTGAGKSTFINTAAGERVVAVGHSLQSCTQDVTSVVVHHPHDPTRGAVLIDTPGFNDTWLDDRTTMSRILTWLSSRNVGAGIRGILYLHDLAIPRAESPSDAMAPTKLNSPLLAQNVVLVTTRWGRDMDARQLSEDELFKVYWKTMRRRGSRILRFTDTRESAWEILDSFPEKDPLDSLIHSELSRILKDLPKPMSTSSQGFFSHLFGKFRSNRRDRMP